MEPWLVPIGCYNCVLVGPLDASSTTPHQRYQVLVLLGCFLGRHPRYGRRRDLAFKPRSIRGTEAELDAVEFRNPARARLLIQDLAANS